MSDIIDRLLDEAEKSQRKGHLLLAAVCRDASDKIGLLEHEAERLRAAQISERKAWQDEVERLRREVLRGREVGQ